MKKFIIIFIVVMVVVLGLFFWSVSNESARETKESGTLVMEPIEQAQGGEYNV